MKCRAIYSLLLLLVSLPGLSQSEEEIDLRDYLPLNAGDLFVYQCTFKHRTSGEIIKSTDSVLVKSSINQGMEYFYFWENDPPYFFISSNSFIQGVARYSEDSLLYIPVDEESSIISTVKDEIGILPVKIKLDGIYKSQSMYGDKVLYKVSSSPFLRLENTILVEKATKYDSGFAVDSIWLKKGQGCIRYLRSTGRNEVLLNNSHIELEPVHLEGKTYVNSHGDTLMESQMIPAYLSNCDFTTAEYDSNCRLIKETFYGTTGEMGIKYITYAYDDSGRLIKELYHYTESLDPNATVKKVWLNEYLYNSKGKLTESRHKFDINDSDYYDKKKFGTNDNVSIEDEIYSKRHKLKCY